MKQIKSYAELLTEEEKQAIINDYVNNFLSIKALSKKYNIKSRVYIKKLLGDKIRSSSEANKIAHKLHPEWYKLDDKAKEKIRQARLKFMKEHPEKTAWRMGNFSYLEKRFQEYLIKNNFNKKYLIVREYSIFPYFIDFAFVDYKLAVELDGSQHLLKERQESDNKKDELLKSLGWVVVRISAKEIQERPQEQIDKISEILNNITCVDNSETIKFGIVKAPKTYQKAVRLENGKTQKQVDAAFKQHKVERPSKEELLELIQKDTWEGLGRRFGVNGNAIKKWCKDYNLPSTTRELNGTIKVAIPTFDEFKQKIEEIGLNQAQLAKYYNVHSKTIRYWLDKYNLYSKESTVTNLSKKKVGQYDKNMNLLNTYESVKAAMREHGQIVQHCLHGRRNSTYIWKFIYD